jgi:hypothetical protein
VTVPASSAGGIAAARCPPVAGYPARVDAQSEIREFRVGAGFGELVLTFESMPLQDAGLTIEVASRSEQALNVLASRAAAPERELALLDGCPPSHRGAD